MTKSNHTGQGKPVGTNLNEGAKRPGSSLIQQLPDTGGQRAAPIMKRHQHAITLAGFALIAALVLSTIHGLTKRQISINEQQLAERQLAEVLPAHLYNNDPSRDKIFVRHPLLGGKDAQVIYRARNHDKPVAAVISTVAPDGYNGAILLLVAIQTDGTISGVRVTRHRETPGLGDAIEIRKSRWITDFNQTSLTSPQLSRWLVKRDGGTFDQFTGATVTPRAVVKAVRNTLVFFQQYQANLFDFETGSTPVLPGTNAPGDSPQVN